MGKTRFFLTFFRILQHFHLRGKLFADFINIGEHFNTISFNYWIILQLHSSRSISYNDPRAGLEKSDYHSTHKSRPSAHKSLAYIIFCSPFQSAICHFYCFSSTFCIIKYFLYCDI